MKGEVRISRKPDVAKKRPAEIFSLRWRSFTSRLKTARPCDHLYSRSRRRSISFSSSSASSARIRAARALISINASGLSETKDGVEEVNELTEIISVDIVSYTGTGRGMHESLDRPDEVDRSSDYINVNAEKERDTSILNQYREAAGLQPVADSTPAEREDAALVAEYLESAGIKPKAKEPPEGAKDYLEALMAEVERL